MSREIYPALSGALAAWREMEVVANDLANVGTDGYKRRRLAFESRALGSGPFADAYVVARDAGADLSDGPLVQDEVPTHLALRGPGFFVVQLADGSERLLRSGRFRLDADRRLVAADGAPVLGEGGPIEIPEGATFAVAEDGRVITGAGDEIGRIRVVVADRVAAEGAGRWRALSPVRPAEDAVVVQGAIEGSNVDPIAEMTRLVEASRSFEVFQRAMQTSDELDARTNEMGRS